MPSARPALARRYAEALCDLLEGAEERQRALYALERLAELWTSRREVRGLLSAPSIPLDGRIRVLTTLLGEAPPDPVLNLLRLVVEHRRHALLPLLPQAFENALDEREGVVRVTVTSATPLRDEQLKAVAALAERLAGRPVKLDQHVDASLIGGLQLRVGDRLVDASLRTQLDRLVEVVAEAPLVRQPVQEGD